MHDDPWLERRIARTVADCGSAPVLALGCGPGADTAVLARAGLEIVALELDAQAAERLFATGWRPVSREHYVTGKYANPKALWEIVLERDG